MITNVVEDGFDIFANLKYFLPGPLKCMQFFNGLDIPLKKLTKLHIWMYIICYVIFC
jgi:hypothetical protein